MLAATFQQWFFEYDTPKCVRVQVKTVGCIKRILQLLILSYVIIWVIILNKGYQEFSSINSAVTSKIRGVAQSNYSHEELNVTNPDDYNRIWDTTDYSLPESSDFFVLTKLIITPNQTMGECPDYPSKRTTCTALSASKICIPGKYPVYGNGIFTGRCVDYNSDVQTCEVKAWCPIEYDLPSFRDKPLLKGTENFTVLIKNSIAFPLWGEKTRNILKISRGNEYYLSDCLHDAKINPFCPIFSVGKIVKDAGENYTELAIAGGMIAVIITWDCNLDYDIDDCIPKYTFRRLDNKNNRLAKGWNFWYTRHFDYEKTRTLYRAHGILFVVSVQGRGGKFSTIALLMNIGAGLGLFSLASIGADFVLINFTKRKPYYRQMKFESVYIEDGSSKEIKQPDIPKIANDSKSCFFKQCENFL